LAYESYLLKRKSIKVAVVRKQSKIIRQIKITKNICNTVSVLVILALPSLAG